LTAVDDRAIGGASQHDRRGRSQAVRDGGRRLGSDAVGHASAIDHAYTQALAPDGRPVAILARTIKGKGVRAIENRNGFHGKPLADPAAAIAELGGRRALVVAPQRPIAADPATPSPRRSPVELPSWRPGDLVATRRAYGEALRAVGAAEPRVVAMDGEVGNSTYSQIFRDAFPERYFEMYVAEQQMVATAIGVQARGRIPFASTFAAFWTRAYDFIRVAAISRADIRLVGSHTGVTVGEDGPSQMALEDIAMFRAIHDSTVLVTSDANQTAALVEAMLKRSRSRPRLRPARTSPRTAPRRSPLPGREAP
jgi:transketolase